MEKLLNICEQERKFKIRDLLLDPKLHVFHKNKIQGEGHDEVQIKVGDDNL